MPGLFITSPSDAEFAGVYAVEISPPKVVEGVSRGYIGFVGQFAWGPHNEVYTPEDTQDFFNVYEPAGSPRSSSGYRALMKRKRLAIKVVRVLGAGSAAATRTMVGTGGNAVATAKYHGTLGNSITLTQQAPASGASGVKDYVVTLTDSVTGTTEETYSDVPLPTGADVEVDVSASKLLGSLVLAGAMTAFPADASGSFTGGANGAGLADAGVALFEVEDEVRVVCCDLFTESAGVLEYATVNAAFRAHAADKGDRVAVLQGKPDLSWTNVKAAATTLASDAAASDRVIFVGPYSTVKDDAGTAQDSPWATSIATALVNLDPHESHAWWDEKATTFYSMHESAEAPFSVTARTIRKEGFERGICLPIRLPSGAWAMQHDRNLNTSAAKRYATRRRYADYLALSLVEATPSFVNGPNAESENKDIKGIVDAFLNRKRLQGWHAAHATDIASVNNATTLGLGQFFCRVEVTTHAPREKILFLMNVGPTVEIQEA
jgi:hypothetical protein